MQTEDLENIILTLFRDDETHGYHIHKQLLNEGYTVELGRLYRILNKMAKDELLKARWVSSSSGPRRRLYSVDKKGHKRTEELLLNAIKTIHVFYLRYLLLQKPDLWKHLFQKMLKSIPNECNIVLLTKEYRGPHELTLQMFHQHRPQGQLMVIKPPTIAIKKSSLPFRILDGTFTDLPLKDKFSDILLVISLPSMEELEIAITEWARAVNDHGRLVIMVPSFLIKDKLDPSSMGFFIEMKEHSFTNHPPQYKSELINKLLHSHFSKITVEEFVHFTVFLAKRT